MPKSGRKNIERLRKKFDSFFATTFYNLTFSINFFFMQWLKSYIFTYNNYYQSVIYNIIIDNFSSLLQFDSSYYSLC